MPDRKKVMLQCKQAIDSGESVTDYSFYYDVLSLLKEQEKTRKFYAEKCDELYAVAKSRVEVVRCKDCVYWQDNNEGYPHKDCKWREDETPDPDDYCSAGERKEGW